MFGTIFLSKNGIDHECRKLPLRTLFASVADNSVRIMCNCSCFHSKIAPKKSLLCELTQESQKERILGGPFSIFLRSLPFFGYNFRLGLIAASCSVH